MNNSKLLIIAPMPPLRGGIPWHSHHLAKYLKSQQSLEVWSPKKLYPNWLYPGKNQFSNDPRQENYGASSADRRLSQIRILFRLLSISRHDFEAVLVPWWTSYFSVHTLVVALIAKSKGVRTAIFCHNVYPHNGSALGRALSRFVVRRFAHVFVQSQSEFELLKSFYPKARCRILSHPTYPSRREQATKLDRRDWTSGPIRVLFFGFLREYKGIDTLLAASRLVNPEKFHFHFAGEPWSRTLENRIDAAAQKYPNISCDLSYHSELRMLETFDSCDVVVLPYSQSTGSGALATAKGMGVPVIISDRIDPGPEFVEGRDGIIFPVGDSPRLLSALQHFRENISDFDQCWVAMDHDKEWGLIAVKIVEELGL